jgi:hypothetical protein
MDADCDGIILDQDLLPFSETPESLIPETANGEAPELEPAEEEEK